MYSGVVYALTDVTEEWEYRNAYMDYALGDMVNWDEEVKGMLAVLAKRKSIDWEIINFLRTLFFPKKACHPNPDV